MNQPVLELINVTAGYGRIPVLHEVNLSLCPGDIYALLGPNGGGKSLSKGAGTGFNPRCTKYMGMPL